MNESRMPVGGGLDHNRPPIPGIRWGAPAPDSAAKRSLPRVERCLPQPNGDPPVVMLWGEEKE
jgi:hypothetical protein